MALSRCAAFLAFAGLALAVPQASDAGGGPPAKPLAAGWVSGTVQDEAGKPFAGAEVQVVQERPKGLYKATTDAKGFFSVKGVPAGPATVFVRAKGRIAVERVVKVPTTGVASVEATLAPGVRFAGKIADMRGQPVGGAKLIAVDAGDREDAFSIWGWARLGGTGKSEPDGTFVVDGLSPGGSYKLRVVHPRHAPVDLPGLPAEAGAGHDSLDVVMEDAAWITGVVVDTAGRPVVGARVAGPGDPFSFEQGRMGWVLIFLSVGDEERGMTDARGRFVVGSLTGSSARLSADADGHFASTADVEDLVAGRETKDVRIVLEAAMASIAGTVADPSGKPVAGASIRSQGDVGVWDYATSDEKGRFHVRRVRSRGPVTLHVEAEGYLTVALEKIALDARELKVALRPAPRIKVKVLGADGKPVPAVFLRIRVKDGTDGETEWRNGPQSEAGIDLPVPEGAIEVFASAEGFAEGKVGEFTAESGKPLDGGTVTLATAPPVPGKADDE